MPDTRRYCRIPIDYTVGTDDRYIRVYDGDDKEALVPRREAARLLAYASWADDWLREEIVCALKTAGTVSKEQLMWRAACVLARRDQPARDKQLPEEESP